ncbi:nucleolar protein 11 [Bufo gargarizans]|uniref:nucleolar protein 11 n=1 Tax=Bufo gargarizans TaxID=30331 RepID=UPI001CF24BD8|nr:nucleolar protein 11 [Bufo gargarizans]XP_044153238.1 nucleolar protein 11 [Bufo gargarizans]
MAALCEEFTLCGLLSEADGRRRQQQQQDGLQGVEEAGEPDTVLVTDSGRTVTLYKVSDQRPLGSWAVRQGQRITCPAVYNHSTGEYVVVHDEKVLRVWKDEDVGFDKAFKATLSADVCRVHSLPDSEPLVLFRGGALRYLDALLADPQQEIETVVTEDEKIIWSQVLVDGGQPVFIFITEKRPDWFVYTWRPAFSASQRWRLLPAADGSTALDFSAMVKNKMVFLAILYSSGHVHHTEVSLAPCDQELELLVSPLLQLPEAADTGALLILHESYIVTLTPCAPQQKDRLCIWNTSFQTLQDSKEFSQKTWRQLWSHNGKLFVPHANSLLVLRYTCEPSCLASALGKGRATQKSAPEAVSIVNWEALTGKAEQPVPAATRRTPRKQKPQSSVAETSSYLTVLSDIQAAPEGQIPSLVQRVFVTAELAHFQIAISSVAQGLVTRCQRQPRFYPQSAIITLVESGVLSYSACPDLMTLCLEKQDVQALNLCLKHYVDIPEGVLCSCLKAFLSVSEEILSKAIINTKSAASYIQEGPAAAEEAMEAEPVVQNGFSSPIAEEDSCDVQHLDKSIPGAETQGSPVSLRRAVLLNSVLTSLFSENFLLPHLKDLTSEQVVLLLRYLHYLYKKCSESVTLGLPGEERLSITQVVDWMNLILDANFTVLVLLPKAKPLLRTLQKFVRSQMKFFSELNKIEGTLSELQKLKRSSRRCGRYSIEVLELY